MNLLRSLFFIFFANSVVCLFAQEKFLGERYAYKLTYLSIPAVNIYLSAPEMLTVNGKKALHLLAIARTTSLFSAFYTLENRYHTYIDQETGLPVKFNKTIHQRTLEQQGEISYDQANRQAVYNGGRFTSQVKMSMPENTHNLFSMIYFLRRDKLEVGQKFSFNLDVESEPWTAETHVDAKEKVDAADSTYDAYKVSFQFIPTKEEFKRKHTDILTRRVATSKTRLYFWIGADPPFPFLKVEFEMSPFSAYTTMVKN
ncbi:DUF3108 domain-containing protein [bacterium]|nr:DUF3108 domain-containing protein [bacterium]